MKAKDVDTLPCSIARSAAIVGDRWTMLILRGAFLRTRRFDDFQAQIGLTRHRLSDRLQRLVKLGVLEKQPYQERPLRYEYKLTEKGRDLYPVLMSMVAWADKWLDEGRGPPLEYRHHACGHKFRPVLACSECGEAIDPRQVTPMPGPGLVRASAAAPAPAPTRTSAASPGTRTRAARPRPS
ncbi:MAG TPA: helix-turn-helix domain-containing protein [Nevskiaceae bacterium]|nr:helix-turn-helix domain-containing protein [Nevskiaceae bacterium]